MNSFPGAQGLAVALLLFSASPVFAQRDRIASPISSRRTALTRGVPADLASANDEGPLDAAHPMGLMTLMLTTTAGQQLALEQLLAEQQDPAWPNYHKWLTPDEFGERFGVSPGDLASLTDWLRAEGFTIRRVARSRTSITFSGTADQARRTFQTELHRYRVNGKTHYANVTAPSIPAAFDTVIGGIRGLHDFHPRSHVRRAQPRASGDIVLAPDDLATIYSISKLYSAGFDGTGMKAVVVGQSSINLTPIQSFRKTFSLPTQLPTPVLYGDDPGYDSDEATESYLDLEWLGAVARNATIYFVYSSDVDNSAEYAIDENLAPVISYSYGICETMQSKNSSHSVTWERTLAQQANAQGITWLASSGDRGAADCDYSVAKAKSGYQAEFPASLPEITAVGGTEFNEGTGTYWDSSTGNALSYMPEKVWNDSDGSSSLAGSGGGASTLFTKPSWQTGTGVPSDNARDIPDISLTASGSHDPYLIVTDSGATEVGGTSASTPAIAGMIVLLNQYLTSKGTLSKPGLGNINPTLYRLATAAPSVYHDITVGDNGVPCVKGTTDCTTGYFGWKSTTGYDLATGLGSVDAYNLVTNWNATTVTSTTTTVAASSATIVSSDSAVLTATVKATGTATPTGSVTFNTTSASLGTATLSGSSGTATAKLTVYGSQLKIGANTITAQYAGGTSFASSSGTATVTVTVPVTNSAVTPTITPSPVYQQDADADGNTFFFTVTATETAGTATTLTDFTVKGTSYASQIKTFFGTTSIPAKGTLSASFAMKGLTVPADVVFGFSGTDASGYKWTQQVTVPFYAKQLAASLTLTNSPATVVQNTSAASTCQYHQQLYLQEQNGYSVQLTRYIAGSHDHSADIPSWFGSVRLAPYGSLRAGICWSGITPPQTIEYEVDGVDSNGNKIITKASTTFKAAVSGAGALSVSKSSVPFSTAKTGQTLTDSVTVTVPSGQQWTASIVPKNRTTTWLVASPLSGTGPAKVSLVANGTSLAAGAYQATLVFESVNTIPQFVDVPVTFVSGASTTTTITGVSHGASFKQAFAPGMILSVWGANLASTTSSAASVPLPLTLGNVSATVNGIAAPLYYVSPTQLNIQIPYEVPAGTATLAVNNNGQVASYSFTVALAAPGIFTDSNSNTVPYTSGTRGQTLVMFITGDGDVTPILATGAAPSTSTAVSQLPAPRLASSMTIGGATAKIAFIGIPYGLVGVTQVNFEVPQDAPLGVQPVVITVGGVASAPASLNVHQ